MTKCTNSWRREQNFMTGKKCFHDVVSDSWRKIFSWRELYFITDQTIGLMTYGANSWRRVQNFMTENNGFHAVVEWFMTENYFMTGVWFHDGKKKSMTGNKDVSWRILNFMTQKTFSWRKIDDFMTPKTFHDGKKVDFPDVCVYTYTHTCMPFFFFEVIDWCCFYYFVESGLVAMLETLYTWISFLDSWHRVFSINFFF